MGLVMEEQAQRLIAAHYAQCRLKRSSPLQRTVFRQGLRDILDCLINEFATAKISSTQFISGIKLLRCRPSTLQQNTVLDSCSNNEDMALIASAFIQFFGRASSSEWVVKWADPAASIEPARSLGICPEKPSLWSFERWSRIDDMARYPLNEHGLVSHLGFDFKCGDVLCCETNLDAGGMFSCAYTNEAKFTHVALYCTLTRGTFSFPSVVEIHEHGVRAVPLCEFLSERYCTSVEQYRHVDSDTIDPGRMQSIVMHLLESPTHFDFIGNSEPDKGFTCASVVDYILSECGLRLASAPRFEYSDNAKATLRTLGQRTFVPRLTPDSFTYASELSLLSHIEGGDLCKHRARAVVATSFGRAFRELPFDFRQLPRMSAFMLRMAIALGESILVSSLVLRMLGFSHKSPAPNAPFAVLAFVAVFDRALKLRVKALAFHPKSRDVTSKICSACILGNIAGSFNVHHECNQISESNSTDSASIRDEI